MILRGVWLALALAVAMGLGYVLPNEGATAAAQTYPTSLGACVYASPTPAPSPNGALPLSCNASGQLITTGAGGGSSVIVAPTVSPGGNVGVTVACQPAPATTSPNGTAPCVMPTPGYLGVQLGPTQTGQTSSTPLLVRLCDSGVPSCFGSTFVNNNATQTLPVTSFLGRATTTPLTATLGTCTSLITTGSVLDSVMFASSAAQTGTLTIYDEGGSPSCTAADARYVSVTHAIASAPDNLGPMGLSMVNGIAYKWTTAIAAGVVLGTYH